MPSFPWHIKLVIKQKQKQSKIMVAIISIILLNFFSYFFLLCFVSLSLFFSPSVCLSVFLVPYPTHMEVLRLGVESKLQLPACTTATAMWDPSCVCNLHHSSQQRWIFNPLSQARDPTFLLMDTSQACYC